jgi:2-polyprenyl-6-methoxyphenol hydroxylase-like FAD-dependent oxidoreductase
VDPLSDSTRQSSRVNPPLTADVIIVGAGLAGALAALVLGRRGMRVTIIDRQAIYPDEFRSEKLSPVQMSLMRELGVLADIADVTRPFDRILVIRGGRYASILRQAERGLVYSDMVNRFRDLWPANVSFIEGRAAHVATAAERQLVLLADGREITARLIILATGPSDKLHNELGFKRQLIRRAHCICLGFDIAREDDVPLPFESMTYFGERAGDRVGYLTIFPQKQGLRVNLFSYHEKREPWLNAFQNDPIGKLRDVMPGIEKHLGVFRAVTPVEIRPVDLYATQNFHRDGIVLIGDAFLSACPATGSGVTRILTDIRLLCLVHVPRWFATPGMDVCKTGSFYDDAVKQSCDEASAKAAERGRRIAVETGLRWRLERALLTLIGRSAMLRWIAHRYRGAQPFSGPISGTMT